MGADFSGYASRNGIRCADGRTIMAGAFKHQNGMKVPLVWQHLHNEPINVLGHAVLENREDGVYAHAYFNDTDAAKHAKALVQHRDITALSIYANHLKQQNKNVQYGDIKEVSLVMAGANPGAYIENVTIQHGDNYETMDDEAVIYTGLEIVHGDQDESTDTVEHADEKTDKVDETEGSDMGDKLEHADETVKDVFDTLTEKQKNVFYFMLGEALDAQSDAKHSDTDDTDSSADNSDSSDDDNTITHDLEGNTDMGRNVFEQAGASADTANEHVLSHDDMKEIFNNAIRLGSAKDAFEDYALKHGIEDIDVLFPDAKAIANTPEFLKRRTEWVASVLDGTNHTPFSRIKSVMADITPDEARAKGFIKGNLKREEFFKVSKRVTLPATIYKKQKLDRDDIIDITDFDVVMWLKGEMRIMLEEELARAILIGDGRDVADEDKISEDNIRPIATDHELYATTIYVNVDDANSSAEEVIDALTLQRHNYRGSGSPNFYTSETTLAKLLLLKDTLGRRLYPTVADVAAALRVGRVVPVEVFEEVPEVVGILVDLRDYNIGTNLGGSVSMFDDFDIDYNTYKYLIETRASGALVRLKSAIVVRKVASTAVLATPTEPTFDGTTVTVPTITGVTYKNKDTNATLTTGSPVVLGSGETLNVLAIPASASYYFASNANDEWTFTNEA